MRRMNFGERFLVIVLLTLLLLYAYTKQVQGQDRLCPVGQYALIVSAEASTFGDGTPAVRVRAVVAEYMPTNTPSFRSVVCLAEGQDTLRKLEQWEGAAQKNLKYGGLPDTSGGVPSGVTYPNISQINPNVLACNGDPALHVNLYGSDFGGVPGTNFNPATRAIVRYNTNSPYWYSGDLLYTVCLDPASYEFRKALVTDTATVQVWKFGGKVAPLPVGLRR